MSGAALSIAYGRVELLVARREESGLEPVYRSVFRFDAGSDRDPAGRACQRLLSAFSVARALGGRDLATVFVPNGRGTAVAARLALAAGSEVRLLRGGDERALVFAGATLDRPRGRSATVCALEDGVVDIVVGVVGSSPRWAASVVAAQAASLPAAEALRRLRRLVAGLDLPHDGELLFAGSGARSLKVALQRSQGLTPRDIVDWVDARGVAWLAAELGVSYQRARRIGFAAAFAQAVAEVTGCHAGYAAGGLVEGALLHPVGLVAQPAPRMRAEAPDLVVAKAS
jgi:hypothetical protein